MRPAPLTPAPHTWWMAQPVGSTLHSPIHPIHPTSSGLVDGYTLGDLQAYLQQYPAAHYSHGGKEPLLYAVVLLLSLQFRCGVGVDGAGRE